jgi:hypothetical protein
MRTARIVVVALVGIIVGPALAAAQIVERRPTVEVGASLDGLISWWGAAPQSGGLRLSVPTGRRFAIEGLATVMHKRETTAGLYGVQVRQQLRSDSAAPVRTFATYGAAGVFAHYEDDTFVSPPVLGLIGAGAERAIGRRLAVRAEAQAIVALVFPVGVRLSAGVSIPIGALR